MVRLQLNFRAGESDQADMNKAFVQEDDGAGEPLPDREIPSHPNPVTAEGLAQIEAMLV